MMEKLIFECPIIQFHADEISPAPEAECRFNDAGRCTYGDGAPECAKEKNEHGKM